MWKWEGKKQERDGDKEKEGKKEKGRKRPSASAVSEKNFLATPLQKNHAFIRKNLQLLEDFVPRPPTGVFASRPHWGTSVPQTPLLHAP